MAAPKEIIVRLLFLLACQLSSGKHQLHIRGCCMCAWMSDLLYWWTYYDGVNRGINFAQGSFLVIVCVCVCVCVSVCVCVCVCCV